MAGGIDDYAGRDSPIHRWDPRYKLVGLFGLAFAFAAVEDLRLLPVMVAATVGLTIVSGLPSSFVWNRLRYPGIFIALLGFVLPFLSGHTVLVSFGPFALRQEGSLDFLLIAVRFGCILTLCLLMFGTATMLTNIKALRVLGLPGVLVDMTLLSYRYIYELGHDLSRMQRATRLRGFRPSFDRVTLATLASLVGTLLARSHERSQRIYHAMILRGYDSTGRPRHDFRARPADISGLGATLLLAAGFAGLQLT